jgi:hypothetical protein
MIFLTTALKIVLFLSTAEVILSEEPRPIVWGKAFGLQMEWDNINMSCKHNMQPVCCAALEDLDSFSFPTYILSYY